jgi:Aflatoxin regulatory protein/Fungal Zn(2)-Cys(6) binuclear cluster domain
MEGVHPPRPDLPTPSTSTHGHTTVPDRPKLRNSCHACASSKLKCSQEKPTCSRCAKRGLTCEYVAAKRGGRKPNSRSSISDNRGNDVSNTAINGNDNVHLPSQANRFAPPSPNPSTDPLRSPGVMHHSTKANVSGSSDMLQDFFGPMDQTLSWTSTDTETDLDDFFTSPISFSTEMSDVNIFGTADFFPTGIDSSSNGPESLSDAFPVFEDAVSELLALSIPSSTPKNSTSPSKEVHNYQEVRATESPCSCLVQALGFMKQLFPSSSNACMTWATQGLDKATAIPTIQAVIAQNEATIEAVSTMLKCSCSQDGYLLAVMSLIIFKVLGWYAAVARKTPSLQGPQTCHSRQSSPSEQVLQNPTVVGSYCLDGADSARMAAQLVLSELHRVRRLVDQLSLKLKVQAANKGRGGGAETPESLDLDNEMTLPLSAVMYDQLDVDLRKRLRALSWEMIDRLRRL